MASKSPSKSTNGYPQTQWVMCDLPKEVKERLKSEKVNVASVFKSLGNLVEQGYKVSISRDDRADCVGAYLTAPRNGSGDPVKCLSARGPSIDACLMVLLYKHYEILQEDWSGAIRQDGLIDPWG